VEDEFSRATCDCRNLTAVGCSALVDQILPDTRHADPAIKRLRRGMSAVTLPSEVRQSCPVRNPLNTGVGYRVHASVSDKTLGVRSPGETADQAPQLRVKVWKA
jgi:hypothetical protein